MTTIDLVAPRQLISLADELAAGRPYALLFGGQGTDHRSRLTELRGAYGDTICADRLWSDALGLLDPIRSELAPWWPADGNRSIPSVAFTQLLELRALRCNRLDVRSSPPVAVAGHSQGLLPALVAAGVATDVAALALAHLLGIASACVARREGLVAGSAGAPMVSVDGLALAELHGLVADFESTAPVGSDEADRVVIGVTNGPARHVVVGRPECLGRFRSFAEQADAGIDWEPLPIDIAYHHPALAPAVAMAAAWATACDVHLDWAPRVAVANDVSDVGAAVISDYFDWPATVERAIAAGAEWVVDLGPGRAAGNLAAAVAQGRGIGFVAPAPNGGVSGLFTPGAAPAPDAPFTSHAPGLLELDDGRVVVDTKLTRLTGQSAFVLAGMTPTTVDASIVASAANAGIWAELAGGGQVTAKILRERFVELAELLDDGVAIHFNTLFLDPYLWNLHLGPNGALLDALRNGAPIRGVTVSAGIPPLDDAVELYNTLVDLGVETVTFKPGTVDGIGAVIDIADAVAPRAVVAHIEGGKAGGHHSWEELDHLLLATYADMRRRDNLVVCVGGGIGTPERAATYLDGSWARAHRRPPMPVDGILVGTAAMACAEATTSPSVKALLASCEGTGAWIDAGAAAGGVASGRSQLGADIHEVDNTASRVARLLDEVAGDAEAVDRRRDEIIDALARTAKPFFGDLAAMTYDDVLTRFAELCAIGRGGRYEDGRWLDESWRRRFVELAQRAEARLHPSDHGPIPTRFGDASSVDDPDDVLASLREGLDGFSTTLLHPFDVAQFVEVFRGAGKPVPFVGVIDAEVRRWWRSDSLWQAHDDRYPADAVVVIPGPAAVGGIQRVDEPVAGLFERFERHAAEVLRSAGVTARRRAERRELAFEDVPTLQDGSPLATIFGEPAVTWAGRRRKNPVLAIAPADAWLVDDHGVGTAPTGARLVPGDAHAVLSIDLGGQTTGLRIDVPGEASRRLIVTEESAASWSAELIGVARGAAAGGPARHDVVRARDHAALFGGRAALADSLVGAAWPQVFSVLDPSGAGGGLGAGFIDLVHLDHTIHMHEQLRTLTDDADGGPELTVDVSVERTTDTAAGRVIDVGIDIATTAPARPLATLRERFLVRGTNGTAPLDAPPTLVDRDVCPSERRTLARVDVRAPETGAPMAAFSGDHNPLHESVDVARVAGFASPIVHGMWISAAMQQAARSAGGTGEAALLAWQARFAAPIGHGDRVEITVVRTGHRGGANVVEVTARADGDVVAMATGVIAPPTTAYAFPGQGIQRVGMGLDALGRSAAARGVWARADRHTRDRLGFSILHVVRDNPTELCVGDADRFRHPDGVLFLTQFTQVAMATLAAAQVAELREAGALAPDAIACGHSVGEYNALAAITGILPFEDVLEVVYHRGLAMHGLVPRDEQGASPYRLAAVRPTEAGMTEAELVDLVSSIAGDEATGDEFLQVVNYNLAGRQYAVAGTIPSLDALHDELERRRSARGGKGVFVTIPGIDVPFHSSVLRPGVPAFRTRLDAILPAELDPALLVGRYVPNLVPRLFSLERVFVEEIAATVPSDLLRDVLDDWQRWSARPSELCRVVLLELLAWQFASPVRWIETQDLLFAPHAAGGAGVERFVEIGLGSQPTLTGLARQTVQQSPAGWNAPAVLNIELDRAALFGEDTDPAEDDPAAETTEEPVLFVERAPLGAVPTNKTGRGAEVDDLAWTAGDGVRWLLSTWAKIRPDQLGASDSIETLSDGVSSRRNQLLMDLGAELGLGPIDGAAEADLDKLVGEVSSRARTYRAPGPVLRVAIDEQLRRVTGPANARAAAVTSRVAEHWGLGGGWALHVTATIAAGTRSGASVRGGDLARLSPAAPTTGPELDALVDAAVLDIAATRGLAVTPVAVEVAPMDAASAAALLDGITGPDGVLTEVAKLLHDRLGTVGQEPNEPADPTTDDLVAAVERELGAGWADAVRPHFDPAATLVIDDRWAGQREDLLRLAHTAPDATGERDALTERLGAPLAPEAHSMAHWWVDDAEDRGDADLANRLQRILARAADSEIRPARFADDVALVTGASPGSIAASIVSELLAGGATVVATSSNLDSERVAFYRGLYHRHARLGAALWLAPANVASNADIDGLVEWLTPTLTPTLLFPFAAPAVRGEMGDADAQSETEFRVLLWSIERLVARLAADRAERGVAGRVHVVLPGSPNRGTFGGDGPYGEAKAALDALCRRSVSEHSWGRHVGLVHAIVGWVRGTALMGHNDGLANAAADAGITTYSADEMARLLAALCDDDHRRRAAVGPLDVDLSGGLLDAPIDFAALAATATATANEPTPGPDVDDEPAALIDALPSPPRQAEGAPIEWPGVAMQPRDAVVIVGFGEVGPLGSSRTRFDVELDGRLSPGGVAELGWLCGLVTWEQQPQPGFYDKDSGELVAEQDLVDRYHDRLMDHSGIRFLEDDGPLQSGSAPLLASVYLERDLSFVVDSDEDAEAFVAADPDRTTRRLLPDGSYSITRRAGTQIRVPRRARLPRAVAAQLPLGFDPTTYGIPADMASSLDRVALWNLVATVDAFVGAGIEPAEILGWVHPADVANTQGTGIGGISAIRSMYVDSLLGESRPNDILQEALPNVVAAHVMQSYVGGYGSMIHPVAACATAAVSVEEGFDKIRAGRAKVVVAGGFDDFGPEGLIGFASMAATASSDDLQRAGVEPGRMSRPNDRRRAGFVEGQGGGTIVLARGDVALELGLPVVAVVAWAGSFSDGVNTSIPAPGLGLVGAARGGASSALGTSLAGLGLGADDVAIVSKHDTSTAANDPNESLVHCQIAAALGRTPGNPLVVVSQKSVTGHAKGGAAAFQLAGLCQVMASGTVPPNRSLDCVDPALAEHGHLVWPTSPLRLDRNGPIRAGLVTSLGFGHVAAVVALVHPAAFLATIRPEERDRYLERSRERQRDGQRRRLAAMTGGPPLYRRPDRPFDDATAELAMLRDPDARIGGQELGAHA